MAICIHSARRPGPRRSCDTAAAREPSWARLWTPERAGSAAAVPWRLVPTGTCMSPQPQHKACCVTTVPQAVSRELPQMATTSSVPVVSNSAPTATSTYSTPITPSTLASIGFCGLTRRRARCWMCSSRQARWKTPVHSPSVRTGTSTCRICIISRRAQLQRHIRRPAAYSRRRPATERFADFRCGLRP